MNMRNQLLLTLTGQDRIGLVEKITSIILAHKGNVDASKMAHLGGEFAMLTLISVQDDQRNTLISALEKLRDDGFMVSTHQTQTDSENKYKGWLPYRIEVNGADHEGIIHHITRHLAGSGINIETLDTSMVQAPMSGTPLFTMNAIIVAPPQMTFSVWKEKLDEVCDEMNVNCEVTPYRG